MAETFLQTAHKDRERAKDLGARWDATRNQRYVPERRDLAAFATWLPAEQRSALTASPAIDSAGTMRDVRALPRGQLSRRFDALVLWALWEISNRPIGGPYSRAPVRNWREAALIWAGTSSQQVGTTNPSQGGRTLSVVATAQPRSRR